MKLFAGTKKLTEKTKTGENVPSIKQFWFNVIKYYILLRVINLILIC